MEHLLLDENTKQFSKLIFEIAKTIGGTLWDIFKRKSAETDSYFYTISSKYLNRYYQRFGSLQVLGMHNPMSLSNVFIDINLLDSIGSNKYLNIEALKDSFEKSKADIRSLQNSNIYKLNGISIIKEEARLMVLGAPGGGKSTYLKKIGIESLSSVNKSNLNNYIPILIELKNIDSTNDIEKLLLKELEIAEFPSPNEFLEKSLHMGKLIILLDGLDEVPSELENATMRYIKDFCDRHNKNKFVVSCRVAAYKGGLSNFKNIEIANLDKKQIEEFIKKWFKEKSKDNRSIDVSVQCWEKINNPDYLATLELAQSPLLLTLLCLVYDYQQDFPKNRSQLYREAINVLLKEWNAEKRIHNNAVYKDMTLPFEELLLSHIAHHYFLKNEYFFDKSELSDFISNYVSDNLNAPKYLDGAKILEAISIQQGILVERAKNIYSFSHLTFQEYFTAKYIDDHSLYESYIKIHLFNPKWREIFILLCGIIKAGSDKLLNEIYLKAKSDIQDEIEFQQLLFTLNKNSSNTDLEVKLMNLLLTLIFATNIDDTDGIRLNTGGIKLTLNLIKEVNYETYKAIADSWIIDRKPHLEMHFKLYQGLCSRFDKISFVALILAKVLQSIGKYVSIDKLSQEFCSNMNINYISFSSKSKSIIVSYLESLVFLYQCKKSSILVTKNNWINIELDILTPSNIPQ